MRIEKRLGGKIGFYGDSDMISVINNKLSDHILIIFRSHFKVLMKHLERRDLILNV